MARFGLLAAPGQKVGCRLSTVTVHACSRRSTLTTFKPAAGDHAIDVFIPLAAAYRRKAPDRPGHHCGAPRLACTKRQSDPAKMAPDTESVVNSLVNARMNKRRQMRWSPEGAHRVLQVQAAVMDGRLHAGQMRIDA